MNRMKDRLNKVRTAYIEINPRRCEACWKCINTCPGKVIGKAGFLWHKHIIIQNGDACSGCTQCIKACPYGVFGKL